jgi:hypothetical protein
VAGPLPAVELVYPRWTRSRSPPKRIAARYPWLSFSLR